MFNRLKGFRTVLSLSIICIGLCILTFLSFINPKLLHFSNVNLQTLLVFDAILLTVFLVIVFKKSSNLYILTKKKKVGAKTSFRYISLFTLFTFIPSFLIAVFSLFVFNYGLQNFFNEQITKAVNSSYDVAKNYLDQNKNIIESDVFLMSVGLNRASTLFYDSPDRFKNIARSEKLLRRVDDIFLIDSSSNIIFSDTENKKNFVLPSEEEINKALEGLPVIISNNIENKTSAMIKLNSLIDTYLYISRNVDPEIINFLNETEQAVNFYYTVENKQTGIKITFAIIYILVVGLLLFISTIIAIAFADRLTKPIINLITASDNISKGLLNSRVPESETDEEFSKLNKNFNNMIQRLKKQQDKLLITERYSAWESVARKLAHEIKNPLTPIQLSIDRLQEKFHDKITSGKDEFKNYLSTINRQIKDIENLVNEFSSFARMPNPIFRKIQVDLVIKRATDFYKLSSKNEITLSLKKKNTIINGDAEQLYRAFINLIKNSEDSIAEKKEKNKLFKGKINIEIDGNKDYINISLADNGIGIDDTSKVMTPYYTTKKDGTGLGLPIVIKIINEHKGELTILNNNPGAKILITFSKII
jgi:two-component system, NtrC family, nitrogen regulation sensor histidine kinase NtrY|tara:strand:- start:1961 stop:3730 length:1770 start_codon:yes stop_codon:yes gene_type:complete